MRGRINCKDSSVGQLMKRTAQEGAHAPFETLDAHTAAYLAMLDAFLAEREASAARLFGRTMPVSPVRDKLLRMIVLTFSERRIIRLSHYVRSCSRIASAPTVRTELDRMRRAGLIVILADPTHVRGQLIAPTEKLIRFHQAGMDAFRERFARWRIEDRAADTAPPG